MTDCGARALPPLITLSNSSVSCFSSKLALRLPASAAALPMVSDRHPLSWSVSAASSFGCGQISAAAQLHHCRRRRSPQVHYIVEADPACPPLSSAPSPQLPSSGPHPRTGWYRVRYVAHVARKQNLVGSVADHLSRSHALPYEKPQEPGVL
jgi:hypothetical protein